MKLQKIKKQSQDLFSKKVATLFKQQKQKLEVVFLWGGRFLLS